MVALNEGVAIVTGGGSGMGLGIAQRFARLGTKVVVVGRTAEKIEDAVRTIRDEGGQAIACMADVANEADVERMVETTLTAFGRLDFAANVAGRAHAPKLLHMLSLQEFEDDHAVNSRGVFLSMKHQISAMLRSGGGAIVNITSGSALRGFAYFSAYCAAKHAAAGLTRSAALEYADKGIRINSVAPGAIATPMLLRNPDEINTPIRTSIPMQRFGTMEEIAAATIWLCSDDASYITGQILPVEGGFTASCLTITAPPGTQYDRYDPKSG